ncbi:MAG: sialidase family protein, partial [Promethearchaeota archaeon]
MKNRTLLISFAALLLATQLLLVFPQCVISGFPMRVNHSPVIGQGRVNGDEVRFTGNINLIDHDTPYATQVEPTIAVLSDGTICAGWKEAQTHSGGGYRVGFSYSTDNGHTWSENILMQTLNPGDRQSDPWLVADQDDNLYFVHLDWNDGTGASSIGVSKSVDGGATWLPIVSASDTGLGFDDKETACVDPDGNLYIVWDWYADAGPTELTFTKSTDGGATFQPATAIANPFIPYITSAHNGTLFITTTEWPGLSG